jgi:hypothetical protein
MVELTQAMAKARKAIESLYDSTATVIEYQPIKDPISKRTTQQEVTVLTGQPCRFSLKMVSQAKGSETATAVPQVIKLFIAPELVIKPGSKISVTRKGVTIDYKNSGQPAIYDTHQEIILELFKGWA